MPPPIPKTPLSIPLVQGRPDPEVVIEFFADLACPFSRKALRTLKAWEVPQGVQVLYRGVAQPWHPQSCMMLEGLLSASLVDPGKAWDFALAIANAEDSFKDVATKDLSRHQIYNIMADIAAATGLDKEAFLENLLIGSEACNRTTQLMKWYTKYHRQRSVHTTPTVYINGFEAPDVSSGWTAEQWTEKVKAL
eukprot:TRINITY_DN3040_c0_g1_i1.p1 TRINITY_DN3040_c0_g1~~TRINITY_DN3040_c0_g1_i1.p1  ORF type:complete len:193 (+),score=41.23 TRINITY_DN3040_c0_g1_i1:649-1227(+)